MFLKTNRHNDRDVRIEDKTNHNSHYKKKNTKEKDPIKVNIIKKMKKNTSNPLIYGSTD